MGQWAMWPCANPHDCGQIVPLQVLDSHAVVQKTGDTQGVLLSQYPRWMLSVAHAGAGPAVNPSCGLRGMQSPEARLTCVKALVQVQCKVLCSCREAANS
jgi:hypothetical protein